MVGNFVEELQWRGMLHDITPGAEELLKEKAVKGYIGFDPTADSLHIGNLVQIIILMHFQWHGHTPIVLVGGATGMIGDPSGKSQERKLLDEATLRHNETSIKKQLARFLDFDPKVENAAIMVNNYDWMKGINFIEFARDIGKHISVNYMMAKDSLKKRLSGVVSEGMSFTEFTYQLVQGYDFLHLHTNHHCQLQMGGSDQWGNITTGTELIRRKSGGKAYALTCPLITKADGTKFGKSEGGNVWLSDTRTSAYKFYQYWLNTSDEDAERYIKIFTFMPQEEIILLIKTHHETPHLRILQKKLAAEVTTMVHSEADTANAVKASGILFGKASSEDLKTLDVQTFLDVFEGGPQAQLSYNELETGMPMIELLAAKTGFLTSNGEARRALKENSIAVNRKKVQETDRVSTKDLLNNKFILLQRGKKNYFLLTFV